MSSIFTKILNQEIPADIIWQDDKHFAILDQHPNNPGHLLVIPKREIAYLFEMSDEDYGALWLACKKLAKKLLQVSGAKRIGVVVEGLGVEDHAHIHLIPINNLGDLDSLHKITMTAEETSALAQKLKSAILEN